MPAARAQDPDIQALRNPVEKAFAHAFARLDLSETSTGVLAERGAFLLSPLPYDGTLTAADDAPALTTGAWQTLYAQFTRSYASRPTIPDIAEVEAAAAAVAARGHVPLLLLWQPTDRFRVREGNVQRVDADRATGQLFRPVRSGGGPKAYAAPTPYERTQFFGAAVWSSGLSGVARVPTGGVTFVLDPALVVSADGATVTDIRVDFGDGRGSRLVAVGQPVEVRYPGGGPVDARLTATVAGQTRHARLAFDVVKASAPEQDNADLANGNRFDAFDYRLGRRPYNGTGSPDSRYNVNRPAEYRWAAYLRVGGDRNAPRPIQNPIIILDGFDTGDYDPASGSVRDRAETFTTRSLYDRLDQGTGLAGTLRAQGYDLVVVDYKDSQDFIQRNALGVVDVVEDVQALMADNGRVAAVIGLSMGGLIGRYALLHMEANGGHRVDRFVSFDSPQQGANVPVSFQHFIDDFDFTGGTAAYFHRVFESPAFRQLVYYNKYTGATDPLRTSLFNWFGDRYPALTRNVAIANGGSAVNQLRFRDAPSRGRVTPEFEMVSFRAGGLPTLGVTGVYYDWDLLAAPERTSAERAVYKAEPIVCIRFTGICAESPVGGWFGRVQNANVYDSAPGSWRASAEELTGPIEDGLLGGFINVAWFLTGIGIDAHTDAALHTLSSSTTQRAEKWPGRSRGTSGPGTTGPNSTPLHFRPAST